MDWPLRVVVPRSSATRRTRKNRRSRFAAKDAHGHPKGVRCPLRPFAGLDEGQLSRQPLTTKNNQTAILGFVSEILTKTSAPRGESCANIRPIEVFMARLDDWRWSSHPMAVVRCGCLVLPWDPTQPRLRRKSFRERRCGCGLLWLCCALVCLLAVPAFGQTDVNDVHVAPREVEKPPTLPKSRVWWPRPTGLERARASAEG